MRSNNVTIGVTVIALAISLALMTGPVHADRGPCSFIGATFTIKYWKDAAMTMPWTDYGTNGVGMCSTPASPFADASPVVNSGSTIYVELIVSSAPGSTGLWYELDNGNSPWPSPTSVYVTTSSGIGDGLAYDGSGITITAAMVAAVTPPQCTINEKVAFSPTGSNTKPNSQTFDGHIIDHLILDHTCLGVPEFSLPITALMLTLAPIGFLFKRRIR